MTRPLSTLNLSLNRSQDFAVAASPSAAPDEVPNLSFWIDPNDGTTVTEAGGAGTGISGISDKHGSNNVIQGSSAARPALTTSGGMNFIEFDGVNDFLYVVGPGTADINFGSGEFTILVVAQKSGAGRCVFVNKGGATDGRYLLEGSQTVTGDLRGVVAESDFTFISSGVGDGDVGWTDGNPHVIAMERDNGANLLRTFLDGSELSSTGDISGTGDIDNLLAAGFVQELLLGCTPASASTGQHQNFLLGEVVFYKGALSDSDRDAVTNHLKSKWGVA